MSQKRPGLVIFNDIKLNPELVETYGIEFVARNGKIQSQGKLHAGSMRTSVKVSHPSTSMRELPDFYLIF